MPAGTDSIDLLVPTATPTPLPATTTTAGNNTDVAGTRTSLVEVVSSVMSPSTSSVSTLLELGEGPRPGTHAPHPPLGGGEEESLIRAVKEDLARLLMGVRGEDAIAALNGMVSLLKINAGDVISKEMEIQTELYYIISGRLKVAQMSTCAEPVSNTNKPNNVSDCIPMTFLNYNWT